MFRQTQAHRPRRSGEWTEGKAIAFIVTLAATGIVTLAAREAGMSRKSAYALKRRDPLFASSWETAKRIAGRQSGTQVEGNSRGAAAPSISSSRTAPREAGPDELAWRNRLLVGHRLAAESCRISALATLAARVRSQ